MPSIPTVILKPNARAAIELPWRGSPRANFDWLKDVCGKRTRPEYDRQSKRFLVARPHTRHVLDALVDEYGEVLVHQFGYAATTCVEACWDANPDNVIDCVCGCAGLNHGSGHPLGMQVAPGLSVHQELAEATYIVTANGTTVLT
ncbi:hypothetical protein [Leucobacter sp. 1207-22]|uniref:hypothetical protein n=1 Tax=Leucobacter sp. 1207-22 TaxID=2604456 RepID=UPI00406341D5